MGQKMSKPPIFYTIGQIQFNPILEMAKYVPAIQEFLRTEFPDFQVQKRANLQIRLSDDAPPPQPVQTVTQERWLFTDLKKTSGYVLHPETLSFQTTAYETSEHFLKKVQTNTNYSDSST